MSRAEGMRVQLENAILAQEDLEEVRSSLDRLRELTTQDSVNRKADISAHTSHTVLSYTRAAENLGANALKGFGPAELELHVRLVRHRKKEFAHSDRESRGMTLVRSSVEEVEFVIPISRHPRRPFDSTADLVTLARMHDHLYGFALLRVEQLQPGARLD